MDPRLAEAKRMAQQNSRPSGEAVLEAMARGDTLGSAVGISREETERFRKAAKAFLQMGHTKKARAYLDLIGAFGPETVVDALLSSRCHAGEENWQAAIREAKRCLDAISSVGDPDLKKRTNAWIQALQNAEQQRKEK